jgi:hypothetical protein
MVRYAVDEIGFHCLEVDEDESLLIGDKEVKEHKATVIDAENRFNSELLTQDLKALVEDNWDWQVRRVSDTDCGGFFNQSQPDTLQEPLQECWRHCPSSQQGLHAVW